MIKNCLYLALLMVLFTSCFKEDEKIIPGDTPPINVEVIPMTQYYTYQVYFNLKTGEQVNSNTKSDFDLSFDSADTGWIIRLNTSTFMKAALTEQTEFELVSDTTGLNWQFDKSDGNSDSTAFAQWMKIEGADTIFPGKVYVINRGIDELGISLGLRKIIFEKLINDSYSFRYSNMDNSGQQQVTIQKSAGYNTVQFSFKNGVLIQSLEPETNNWDLLFTQYTTLLYTNEGDAYPYLVTGTLINMAGTEVAFDSTMVFNEVTLDDVLYLDYSKSQDKIGYDWKELFGDINGGDYYYKARSNFNYFIRCQNGLYYKLRFTGFYHPDTGEKGFPTFEYQQIV